MSPNPVPPRVIISPSVRTDGGPQLVRSGAAFRGTMCGGREFDYSLFNLQNHARFTADISGFEDPVVSWTLNGVAVGEGLQGYNLPAIVVAEDPTESPLPTATTVRTYTQFNPPGSPTTFMEVRAENNPGQVDLRVDVTVTETLAPATFASSFILFNLETQDVVWDPEYNRIVSECWNRYITAHNRDFPWLRRYMPDPPPGLLAAAQVLDELAAELRVVAAKDPKLANEINRMFGGQLSVRAQATSTRT